MFSPFGRLRVAGPGVRGAFWFGSGSHRSSSIFPFSSRRITHKCSNAAGPQITLSCPVVVLRVVAERGSAVLSMFYISYSYDYIYYASLALSVSLSLSLPLSASAGVKFFRFSSVPLAVLAPGGDLLSTKGHYYVRLSPSEVHAPVIVLLSQFHEESFLTSLAPS